jgi:hypothetical protein
MRAYARCHVITVWRLQAASSNTRGMKGTMTIASMIHSCFY